ncbi:Transposase [Caligus rogercresseyi]|uniref:Transposase n=1 Tax=Caligus rogercresseyi TaxID=217165 RepID=A0A7T8QW53_CALRO|nr:Transposase [Caligus rogercresseyi]
MSSFVPTNYDLRTALLFCFHLKKTAAESHRMLLEAFGEHALENPKRNKSWVTLGEPSTSTPRPNRYGRKTMLCLWWDQKGEIYYKLLKPGETVILLHDNAPAHKAKQILQHAAYSPDLAPSDYYLFASMGQALAEQRFTSYEDVRKWLDDWFASKEKQFFW